MRNHNSKNTNGMTRGQVCQLLNISRRTLSRRVKNGEIRMVKVNSEYLYFFHGLNSADATLLSQLSIATDANGHSTDATCDKPDESPVKPATSTVYLMPKQPRSAGNGSVAQLATVPQPDTQTVPLSAHEKALDQMRELTNQINTLSDRLIGESQKSSELQTRLAQAEGTLQNYVETLIEAADREQHRRGLVNALHSTSKWKWRERTELRRKLEQL